MNFKKHRNNQWIKMPASILCVLALLTSNLTAQDRPLNNLDVSEDHPRLIYNHETLVEAKTWFKENPFEPRGGEYTIHNGRDAVDAALYYLLSGDMASEEKRKSAAQKAISWAEEALGEMEAVDFMNGANTCNECRWYMEQTLLILDWCDDELTASQHTNFYSTLTAIIPMWNGANWGGPESPRSNFNHGYWRQSVTFALLIYHENRTLALELLDDAINKRFREFKTYAATGGISGIPTEGASYNYAMLSYQILVAGISMANAGYDYVRATPFYERAYVHTIYNTTPDKTFIGPHATHASYLPFPYGDGGAFMHTNDWGEVLGEGHANAMLAASLLWKGEGKLPEYYKGWVEKYGFFEHNYPPLKYLESVTSNLPQADITELPLDYFAPGAGYTPYGYTRTSWEKDATAVSMQLGKAPGGGHEHFDAGTFTLMKGNRFLIVPPTGRGFGSGWRVPDYDNINGVNVENSIAKNTILFGKEGSPSRGYTIDSVDRLMTHPDFFYAANDITPAYINVENPTDPNYTNEHIGNFVRETLFVRPLETLIVFDRTESLDGMDQTKTSLLHVQGEPTKLNSRKFKTTNGDFEAIIDIMLPTSFATKVINETEVSDCDFCQPRDLDIPHRIQIEQVDEKSTYFMNVIQAKGIDEPPLDEVSYQETENTFLVTLRHPTKGFAVVEFEKGQQSTKGRFGYDPHEIPIELMSLPEEEQVIDVTLDGPVWYEVGTRPVSGTPEIITDIKPSRDFQFSLSQHNLELNFSNIENQTGQLRIISLKGNHVLDTRLAISNNKADAVIPELDKNTMYVFELRLKGSVERFKIVIR